MNHRYSYCKPEDLAETPNNYHRLAIVKSEGETDRSYNGFKVSIGSYGLEDQKPVENENSPNRDDVKISFTEDPVLEGSEFGNESNDSTDSYELRIVTEPMDEEDSQPALTSNFDISSTSE